MVEDQIAREAERIEKLSDAELDAELRREGVDPARAPTAEQLLAKAAALAARRASAPDPARGWLFVEDKLAGDEAERIEKLGEAELDAELRREGLDPARAPTAEQLLARVAAAMGAPQAPSMASMGAGTAGNSKVVPLRQSRRIVWWLAAALVLGVGAWIWENGQPEIVARPNDGVLTPHLRAEQLRDEAIEKCGRGDFVTCGKGLDEAAGIDPDGESEPRVREARGKIEKAGGGTGRPGATGK